MGPIERTALRAFRCNICGSSNAKPVSAFGREIASCDGCGSTVRTRALVRMLAREIFGAGMAVPDFPVLKSIRGIGMSDTDAFAERLAEKFDYRNTHYDREPRLDVLNPSPGEIGAYDFIISSEVLEHVAAPVERAFENLFRMLKPDGVLLMTVPYRPEGDVEEHFGPMPAFALAEIDGRTVLIRRSAQGAYEVLDNLVFHGGSGATLEMRVFSDASIRRCLAGAGFDARIYTEDAPEFGVIHDETWSLPIAARKGRFAFGPETRREWTREWLRRAPSVTVDLKRQLDEKTESAARLQAELDRQRDLAADLRDKLNQRNADTRALVLDFDRRIAERQAVVGQLNGALREREKWAAALHAEVAQANAVIARLNQEIETNQQLAQAEIDRLTREIERTQEAAQGAITLVEAELQSRTEWARSLQDELAAARERVVALETLFPRRLFARVKRRLGLGHP